MNTTHRQRVAFSPLWALSLRKKKIPTFDAAKEKPLGHAYQQTFARCSSDGLSFQQGLKNPETYVGTVFVTRKCIAAFPDKINGPHQFWTSSHAMSSRLLQLPTPTDCSCLSARSRIWNAPIDIQVRLSADRWKQDKASYLTFQGGLAHRIEVSASTFFGWFRLGAIFWRRAPSFGCEPILT